MTQTTKTKPLGYVPADRDGAADLLNLIDELAMEVKSGQSMGLGDISIANRIRAAHTNEMVRVALAGVPDAPLSEERIQEVEAKRKAARHTPSPEPRVVVDEKADTCGSTQRGVEEGRLILASRPAPDAVEELLKKAERQARYTESDCIGLVGIAALLRRLASIIRSLRQEREALRDEITDTGNKAAKLVSRYRQEKEIAEDALTAAHTALRELREKVDEALRDMPSFSPNTYGTSLIRRDEARALIASLRSAAPEGTETSDG